MRGDKSISRSLEGACGWCCSAAGAPWVMGCAGLALLAFPAAGWWGAAAVFAITLSAAGLLALRRARRAALLRTIEAESAAACSTDRSCAGKGCCTPAKR